MRQIKIGDKVIAFLDANLQGEAVAIHATRSNKWLVGGVSSTELFVDVKLTNGEVRRVKMSELYHLNP